MPATMAWVLSQEQLGMVRPIAYASRGLKPTERNMTNYSSMKLEFLALKWAMTERFRDYLLGQKCVWCIQTIIPSATCPQPSWVLPSTIGLHSWRPLTFPSNTGPVKATRMQMHFPGNIHQAFNHHHHLQTVCSSKDISPGIATTGCCGESSDPGYCFSFPLLLPPLTCMAYRKLIQ